MNQDFSLDSFSNAGDAVLGFFIFETRNLLLNNMADLGAGLHGTISVFLILVVMFHGVMVMLNRGDTSYRDLGVMLFWAMIVVAITPSIYFNFLVKEVLFVSNRLTAFMSQSDYDTPFAAITASFGTVMELGWRLVESGGIRDPAPVFTGLVTCIIFGAAYVLFALVTIFAAFMLAINFLFGFLLLKLSIFKTWRPVLKTWAQSVLKFALVPVVATLVTSFASSLVNTAMARIINNRIGQNVDNVTQTAIQGYEFYVVLIVGCLVCYVLSKTIEVTAELTGAVANDLGGATRAAAGASRTAAAGSVAAGKGAYKLGKKIYGKGAW
jgi:hypothetical protein